MSTAGVVCAKTWFLPDYQTGELHKKGYQDRGQGNAQNSVIRDNAFGCAAYGYLEAEEVDKPEDCEKNFQLPDGRFCYYNCCEKAPEDYTLYAIPSHASYSEFYDECEEKYKYRLNSCDAEYYRSVDECKACTWKGYTMESKSDSNATDYYSDTCGGKTKYAIKSCNSGYEINGNVCQACTWKGYTITEQEKSNIRYVKSFNSDTCGGVTKYSINSCETCYHPSGNSCSRTSCSLSTCPGNSNCTTDFCDCLVAGDCKDGYTKSCSTCYELTGKDSNGCGTCKVKSCTTTCPTNSVCGTNSCGCYTSPTGCKDGYTKSCGTCYELTGKDSNGCGTCKVKSCTTTCPTNSTCGTDTCGCYTSPTGCKSGYVKSCSSVANGSNSLGNADSNGCGTCSLTCNSCYTKSGNSCVKKTCSTTSCPANATCSKDSCGCISGFTCNSCYTKSGSGCVKKTCSTTSCPANATCSKDSCGCISGFTCNSGYTKSGSGCQKNCSCNGTTEYEGSCPMGHTCAKTSDGCCWYSTGCETDWVPCYGRCDPPGTYCG